MELLSIIFLASLLLGQIGGIPIYAGVVIYIHDILLGVLLVEGFVQYAVTSKFITPKLVKPILFFVFVALFSLLTNSGRFAIPALEVSALYLMRWVFYAALYVLVIQTYTKKELWLYGLYITGVGLGTLGILQFSLYPNLRNLSYLGWDPHYFRLFSTFLDPNFAGIFLVLTILLGIYLWQKKKFRVWIALGEIISMMSLLLTYSRSSYIALIAALSVFALLKKQWIMIAGILVFIVAVIIFPKTPGSTLDLLRTDSTLARVGSWQEGLMLIKDAPILGHGFNTLRYVSSDKTDIISKSAAGVDSSILFVGATTGIVGILSYGYLLYSMIRGARGELGRVYKVSFVALAVHSLFVNSAFYPWVLIWFWIVTGVSERISGDR